MDIISKETGLFYLRLEEAPRLLELCRQAGIAVDDLLDLPAKRQRERAAERLLLRQAFGRAVTLGHDEQGAPVTPGTVRWKKRWLCWKNGEKVLILRWKNG